MKLVGNSAYGKTITNQFCQHDIEICGMEETSKRINKRQYRAKVQWGERVGEAQDEEGGIELVEDEIEEGFLDEEAEEAEVLEEEVLDEEVEEESEEGSEVDSEEGFGDGV